MLSPAPAPRQAPKRIDFDSHRDQAILEDHEFLRGCGLTDQAIYRRLGFGSRATFERWMARHGREVRW